MKTSNEEIHLLDYWRVLSKRRNVTITFFAVVVGIVAVYSVVATPIYQGAAQILVELEKNPTMTFGEGGTGYVQLKDASEYYRTQMTILTSRAFADRVVRKLQLDKSAYFLDRKEKIKNNLIAKLTGGIKDAIINLFPDNTPPVDPFPTIVSQEELDPELIDIILDEMEIEVGKQGSILKINYNSDNPKVAAVLANGIASAYIEHSLDIRVKPYSDAAEWLSARLVEMRSKVEESEIGLQKYKEAKGIVSFETRENILTQKLQELVSQLVQVENIRHEAEVRFNQLKSVITKPELLATVPYVMNNLVIQGLRNEELTLKKQISELSEKFGPKHPQMLRVNSELETVQKNLLVEAQKMLNSAKTEYEIAKSREESLKKTIEEQKAEILELSRKAIEFDVIRGQVDSNKQFYELLLKKMQEASLSSGISISNVQIIDWAVTPEEPIKPKKGFNIMLALIVGLLGGAFSALFIEYMDDTIKTPEDVEEILGIPCLGYIPSAKKEGLIYISSNPKSIAAESYRTIRTGIMFSSAENPPQLILITSATVNEGKTTTSANLAVAMAQTGERVLLIDADMRHHNLHKIFNMDNTIGISNITASHMDFSAAIKKAPDFPNLHIITGGSLAPNPLELLSSNRMKELLTEFRKRYDRIVLDSPPVIPVSDSLILSKFADGVILVVWGGETGRDMIKKTVQSMQGVNAKIFGVVINNVSVTKRGYYQYYPYYTYGEKSSEKTV